jgi:acyl carrier protein
VQSTDLLTQQIQDLIARALNLPVDQILPRLAFGDIPQWDSMGHMEIMLLLEEELRVEINAETITSLTSIELITQHLREKKHV